MLFFCGNPINSVIFFFHLYGLLWRWGVERVDLLKGWVFVSLQTLCEEVWQQGKMCVSRAFVGDGRDLNYITVVTPPVEMVKDGDYGLNMARVCLMFCILLFGLCLCRVFVINALRTCGKVCALSYYRFLCL